MTEITATSPVASEAGREALPPSQDPSPPSIIIEPRDQQQTMQRDWDWVLKVLRMTRDRAQSGTPLHVTRPVWLHRENDVRALLCGGVIGMVKEIFATAVVDEPE
jgi:hypothetical protein